MLCSGSQRRQVVAVAQGPECWGALGISALFCYTLLQPSLFTRVRERGVLASGFGEIIQRRFNHVCTTVEYKRREVFPLGRGEDVFGRSIRVGSDADHNGCTSLRVPPGLLATKSMRAKRERRRQQRYGHERHQDP